MTSQYPELTKLTSPPSTVLCDRVQQPCPGLVQATQCLGDKQYERSMLSGIQDTQNTAPFFQRVEQPGQSPVQGAAQRLVDSMNQACFPGT